MFQKKSLKYFDFWLIIFMVGLILFGIIIIGSATHINSSNSDSIYVKKQILGFISGLILMGITIFFNYDLLKKLYIPIYIIDLLLLLFVLKFGVGDNVSRWISISSFITIQPAEFTKIMMIIFFAGFLDKQQEKINNPLILLLGLFLCFIPVYLVKKQPDLSTSIIIIGILISILFVSKISNKYILIAILLAIPLMIFIKFDIAREDPILFQEYQIERIFATNDYQTSNSIQAIGSGQLEGKGLFNGTVNNFNFLPVSSTDFIFGVVGEEFGFIGCSSVILVILLIISRCFWNAKNSPDLFGKLICCGVATLISFQTFVHIGVTTGLLPNTGIPLPFVSYGLSSLWTNMISIGLVINVGLMRKSNLSRR